MVPVEIAASSKVPGKGLMSVTVRLRDPEDIKIYKAFLKDEPGLARCPFCDSANNVGEDDLRMEISNPLANSFLKMARAIVVCDHCGREIPMTSMMDYSAFKSVDTFIKQLKARNNQIKKEKQGG